MPVTKSAKKALRVSARRKEENLAIKGLYKNAVKLVRKAVEQGTEDVQELVSSAQSTLNRAAKSKTIHKNKAARLMSRLAKKVATGTNGNATTKKKSSAKKAAPKKKTTKKK